MLIRTALYDAVPVYFDCWLYGRRIGEWRLEAPNAKHGVIFRGRRISLLASPKCVAIVMQPPPIPITPPPQFTFRDHTGLIDGLQRLDDVIQSEQDDASAHAHVIAHPPLVGRCVVPMPRHMPHAACRMPHRIPANVTPHHHQHLATCLPRALQQCWHGGAGSTLPGNRFACYVPTSPTQRIRVCLIVSCTCGLLCVARVCTHCVVRVCSLAFVPHPRGNHARTGTSASLDGRAVSKATEASTSSTLNRSRTATQSRCTC